jgi:hypothetical protein
VVALVELVAVTIARMLATPAGRSFSGAAKMEAPATKRKAANRNEFRTRKRIAEMKKGTVLKNAGR